MAITRPSKPIPLGMQTAETAGSRFSETARIRMSAVSKPADAAPDTQRDIVQLFTTRTRATWRVAALTAYFFFFGASTMIIWRPSIFGICST